MYMQLTEEDKTRQRRVEQVSRELYVTVMKVRVPVLAT
jgi:hypothetical protein